MKNQWLYSLRRVMIDTEKLQVIFKAALKQMSIYQIAKFVNIF